LHKRNGYREAFASFDPARVARFRPARIETLLTNSAIVRNRLKIESTVSNARAFLAVQKEFGTFDRYIWSFVGGAPLRTRRTGQRDVPASTQESDALSADLRRRGFRFVGSTIMYAFMQAVGMVNDHAVTCFRYRDLTRRI
jgi:DNA-3-methyladenine glycosylase I